MTADRNGFIQERSPGAFTMRERLFAETRIRRVQDDARREVVVMRERRLARIVAGAVGIAGAALMVATLLRREGGHEAEPAWALAFAVLSAVLAYPAMRGGLRMARALTTEGPLAASSLAGLEPWSIALPLLATALLAPLTLHAVVWAVSVLATTDDTPLPMVVSKMSEWIFWSSIIVGHAHLALAVLVVKLARSIHRSTTEEVVALRAARRGWKHVAITTAVAAVPGVVLLGLPPLIVFVTGAAFVPLAYHWIRARILAERSTIAARDARCVDGAIELEDLEDARRVLEAGVLARVATPRYVSRYTL